MSTVGGLSPRRASRSDEAQTFVPIAAHQCGATDMKAGSRYPRCHRPILRQPSDIELIRGRREATYRSSKHLSAAIAR